MNRVNDFIQNAELLDIYEELKENPERLYLTAPPSVDEDENIGFRNATFAWSIEEEDGSLTPSSRRYRLHIDGELLFERGKINLIVGPT